MKFNSLHVVSIFGGLLLCSISISINAQVADSTGSKNNRENGTLSINGTTTYDGGGAGTIGSDGSYFGHEAGAAISSATSSLNTFIGAKAGKANTTGYQNTFLGAYSGALTTIGFANSFLGCGSGGANLSGSLNTFAGMNSGKKNTSGSFNVFLGSTSGFNNTTGQYNTYLGLSAGYTNISGSTNTLLGMEAGYYGTGSGNVMIGYRAGFNETGNNKLYIANSGTAQPLIFGDFAANKLIFTGKTAIATTNFPTTVGTANVGSYNLFVKGGILTDEIRVRTGWADYVFQQNYNLKSLDDVETYIRRNGHLPNVPSAQEVETTGIELGSIAKIQQEKIEELTLYVIEEHKQNVALRGEVEKMKVLINQLLEKK